MVNASDALAGISAGNRRALAALHRTFSRPFDAELAATALNADLAKTRRLLADLSNGGWLARVRQGWYITVPMDASEPGEWREDPWIVATVLFAPCYIGGWSAAEHWGFTNQAFSSTYVVARRKVKPTDQIIQGSRFKLRSVPEQEWFGTQETFRRDTAIVVSDPHRTIVDIMDNPESAGGAPRAAQILREYFASEHADERQLLSYGDRLGRGALFKRLGFLVERDSLGTRAFMGACHERVSKGTSLLDPGATDAGRIVSRWHLKVNVPPLP
jgi:predicted transcriptional regulator of viral defense system